MQEIINHNMGVPESDGFEVSAIVFEDFYKYEEVDDNGNIIICGYANPI